MNWSNNMEEGYVGQFRGIPIIVKPDSEITEIILPESLATHILQLQNDKMKYSRKELKSIFLNIDI
jgi:hypothetical protein